MSINYEIIFQEAISHSRRPTTLINTVKQLNLSEYENKSFEDIYPEIRTIFKSVKDQLGPLAVYDTTAAICRYHNKNVDRVYIVGGGPIKAVKKLNLSCKTQRISKYTLKYVEIADVISAFDRNCFYLDENVRQSKNGDDFESYICNWQKTL
jgi:hypothetical protein